ncbi:MAG: hypothetical protein QNK04_09790 [Myxococcota bacterium]|nr:hypothetical protein [Myxococcota bacterium]
MSNSLATLPRGELIARLLELVRRGNAVEADLLAHVAEVDARRLYLDEGCPSMFAYCQRALGFAEGVVYKRIQVARAARRFPEILEALRRGDLHLTGLCLLAPKLEAHSVSELIQAARRRSTDEIRRMLADRDPKPDVPASVRRVSAPEASPAPARPPTRAANADEVLSTTRPVPAADPVPTPRSAPALPAPAPRARTKPLGAERYHVQFTADRELYAQLQELRALMRHQVPDGDLGAILARAVFGERHIARCRRGGLGPPETDGAPGAAPTRQLDSNQVGQGLRGGPRSPARGPA